jgi:hypothetical protein
MKKYHKIQSIFKRDEKGNFLDEYSCPEFQYLKDNIWEYTEKIDGTNIRIGWDYNKISIGGKTDRAQIPVFLYDKLNEIFTADMLGEVFLPNEFHKADVTLYGEGFGARIQKGGGNYIPDGVDFILFDVLINGWWLKRKDVNGVAKELRIKSVKVYGEGTLSELIEMVKSKTLKSEFGDFLSEGIVARPKVELFARNGNRIITKLKHKDFK